MRYLYHLHLYGIAMATCAAGLSAAAIARADEQTAPRFSKDIKPFLAKYCMECHNHDDADSNYVVESYESLLKGGDRGAALVPGKPDESRLVLQLEGKAKPNMP